MEEVKNGVFKINNNNPIYIIGDIHGDYQCLIHCLVDLCNVCKITKIYDDEYKYKNREYLEWIPSNNSVVVFCGDIIHRKRYTDHVLDDECSDIYMLKALFRLKKEAIDYGGDILIISGNHEIMNILQPYEEIYTSLLNLKTNIQFFSDKDSVNEYIENSYAWIKINDILITHGGLCSDYLTYFDNNKDLTGDILIRFVNDEYHKYFMGFDKDNIQKDSIGYKLFIAYDINNKKKHNMFWCREWGYSGIDCVIYKQLLLKVGCKKMIIAHCPQFLSEDKPKMINFECKDSDNLDNKYNLARIDLGMSRSFEYNKEMNFIPNLSNNYHRKMAVLKLLYKDNNELYFNEQSIITMQLSCIQYLLLKYGFTEEDWLQNKIKTEWLGFRYIKDILSKIKSDPSIKEKCKNITNISKKEIVRHIKSDDTIILCLLYPLYKKKSQSIDSIIQYKTL